VKHGERDSGFGVCDGRGYGGDPGGLQGTPEAIASHCRAKREGGEGQGDGEVQGEFERQVEESGSNRYPKEAKAWQNKKGRALKFS